jgi:hypothetical protein
MEAGSAPSQRPARGRAVARLDFLGSWPIGRESPCLWALEKLGFPWILSSESSLFNGLRGIFAGINFSRPFARDGLSAETGASLLGMQKRRSGHGNSLIQFLIFCNQLPAEPFPPLWPRPKPTRSNGCTSPAASRTAQHGAAISPAHVFCPLVPMRAPDPLCLSGKCRIAMIERPADFPSFSDIVADGAESVWTISATESFVAKPRCRLL